MHTHVCIYIHIYIYIYMMGLDALDAHLWVAVLFASSCCVCWFRSLHVFGIYIYIYIERERDIDICV